MRLRDILPVSLGLPLTLGFVIAVGGSTPIAAQDAEQRLVVAGGDLTEIVFALGAGDAVVGVDSTSLHPEAAAEREQVGYVRRLSSEGVLSLTPTLVLAAHDAGPANALTQLEDAGVDVAIAPVGDQPETVVEKIDFVGAALGLEAEAATLAAEYDADLAEARSQVAALEDRPRVLFVLSLRGGSPIVGGQGTGADTIITEAAGVNAAQGFDGYKPMSMEAILEAQPDAILMMTQHAERIGGAETVLEREDIALTPAGQNRRVIDLDGMLLLGFGPRTPDAIVALAKALHGEKAAALGL